MVYKLISAFITLFAALIFYTTSTSTATSSNLAMSSLSAVRVPARASTPTAAVIIFHGLGDTGSGWKFLAELAQRSPAFNHIRFVFPNAPSIPITANQGYVMPGWFDILAFGSAKGDNPGYVKALKTADSYVKEVIDSGIPSDRIIIGGFSQGGGIALGKAADSTNKFAGVLALSPAVFPFLELLKEAKTNNNVKTPIFHGHGDEDQMVPKHVGDASAKYFKDVLGFENYEYKTYSQTGHSVAEEELKHILSFIQENLPAN